MCQKISKFVFCRPVINCWQFGALVELITERLILRDYEDNDWERVHSYASIPEFSQYEVWGPNSIEDSKNYIKDMKRNSTRNPRYHFEMAMVLASENLLIGGAGIRRDWESSSFGNFGYAVHPDYQGQGFATEATQELIRYGFEEMGLTLIYATCDTRNVASRKVMEKLGMRKIGLKEKDRKIKGELRDSFCFELLKQDWGRV